MRIKIFAKFVMVMILIAVIPLAMIGLRMIKINRLSLESAILELQINLASSLAEKIDDYIANLNSKLIQVISSLEMRALSWAERQTILQSVLEANPEIVNISLVNQEGDELLKVYNPDLEKEEELITHREDPLFQKAKKERKTQISTLCYEGKIPHLQIIYLLGKDYFLQTSLYLQKLKEKIELTNNLSDGNYFWRIAWLDTQGLESVFSEPQSFTLDTKAPALELFYPAENETIAGEFVYLKGKTEKGAKVILEQKIIPVDEEGNFEQSLFYPPGKYKLVITVIDSANNQTTLARTIEKITAEEKIRREQKLVGKKIIFTPAIISLGLLSLSIIAYVLITILS